MRVLLALVAVGLVGFAACGKSDAEREQDRLRDRAAEQLQNLRDHLADLEKQASALTGRLDAIDEQLTKLTDELAAATDERARAAIEDKLEKLAIDREDIERKLDELREKIAK